MNTHNIRVGDTIEHKDTNQFLVGKVDEIGIYLCWNGLNQLYFYAFGAVSKYIKNRTWFLLKKARKTVLIYEA